MNHLRISVTFLDLLFHGRGDTDPEWPPSPMRLFQALLAGSKSGCRRREWSDAKAEAFRWLEAASPPVVVAPEATVAKGYGFFVPTNDADNKPDRQGRLTTKVARPHRLTRKGAVHYIWAIRPGDHRTRTWARTLSAEARHLLALGWGIDHVVGNGAIASDRDVAALSGRRWLPWRGRGGATRTWRVPVAGSLEELEAVYDSFCARVDAAEGLYRPERALRAYGIVEYLSGNIVPPRAFAAFELPEGTALRPERVAQAAAMLRSLACRRAESDTHEFPGGDKAYVAGHVRDAQDSQGTPARFSYLPLPSIGHRHADGMIRRLLVAEPFGGDGLQAEWAKRRLLNSRLRDPKGDDRGLLEEPWRDSSRRVIGLYANESRHWCSVTPVVLPGFDDANRFKAERLLLKATTQAGIPSGIVEALTLRKAPFYAGAVHPRQYFAPDYIRLFSRWHVAIRFREPICGPLAIGAGRHVGLGLFAGAADPDGRGRSPP